MRTAVHLMAAGLVLTAGLTAPTAAMATTSDTAPVAEVQAPPGVEDFLGIIKLSNCSASLVKFSSSLPTDKGMMMTNGHCMPGAMIAPGKVLVNQAAKLSGTLLTAKAESAGKVEADFLMYGTLTDTDMAIYRLTETYEQIARKTKISPLTLVDRGPKAGDKLTVNSGYWKKRYDCPMEKSVHQLLEAGYTWKESIKFGPSCTTIHGTSGAPIVDNVTGEVVGINNTGNDDGKKCTMNNPCEKDEQGNITFQKGWTYGQQTKYVYTCLTSDRQIDLSIAGCKLAKPTL